jgi:pilus assembly protein TadC
LLIKHSDYRINKKDLSNLPTNLSQTPLKFSHREPKKRELPEQVGRQVDVRREVELALLNGVLRYAQVVIGGDIGHFLERKAEDIFKTRALRVKAAAERLGMLLETFIIVMVLMSLCFYILFSVDAIYSTGVGMYSTMILYTYVFAPMLSLVFIYLAHDMQPKSPITEWRPYKVAAISSAVAAVLFFLLTGFAGLLQVPVFDAVRSVIDLPTALAICLFIATMPAAIVYSRLARKKSEVEKGIASFLRDLTEIRKTGMAPERCIENLSKREYGEFSKDLKTISSQLSWGIPLRQVFMNFIKRTKSWLSQLVIFLLVEGIDVGGGTIAMIESLTRFNNMTQEVEREKQGVPGKDKQADSGPRDHRSGWNGGGLAQCRGRIGFRRAGDCRAHGHLHHCAECKFSRRCSLS